MVDVIITVPTDDPGAFRTKQIYYDPHDPTRAIGSSFSTGTGCGCSPGAFVYRDGRNRIVQVTTADPDFQNPTVLGELEYLSPTDDRLTSIEERIRTILRGYW